MVDIDSINPEPRLILLWLSRKGRGRDTHHRRPTTIFSVLLIRSPHTLRTVQTEQAVVKLSYDTPRLHKVIEQPLLAQRANIRAENREGIRTKTSWLIYGDKDVLQHKRLEFKIALLGNVAKRGGIEVRGPLNRAAIYGQKLVRIHKILTSDTHQEHRAHP